MISLLLVYFPEMAHAGVKQKQFVGNNCYFLSNFEKYSFLIKMQAKVLILKINGDTLKSVFVVTCNAYLISQATAC